MSYPIYIQAGLAGKSTNPTLRRFVRALKLPNIEPVEVFELPMGDLAGDHWSVTGRRFPATTRALARITFWAAT